jgi:FlaG/FlaF family flagellin (archaellin)
VIGVILMVAITVILAAVIGTFVLGLGDSLGNSQPTAQLSVADTSGGNITIEHNGGDPVDKGDLNVVVRNGGASVGTTQTITNLTSVSSGQLGVGESVQLQYDNTGSQTIDNVRLIHTPSESIILDSQIDLDDFGSWTTA